MDFQLNLRTESVQHAFPSTPLICEPNTSIREVFEGLKQGNRGCILVCGVDGVLQGLFTERDALRLMASGDDLSRPISDVMSVEPVTVTSSEPVGDAIVKMAAGGYRQLPIVDQHGKPQGLLKVSGLLHYLVQHFPKAVYTLPPEPRHVTREREGA